MFWRALKMSASMVQGPPGAFANLVAAGFALVIRLVGIFFAVLSWMFFVVSALPYVVLALAVSLLMIPWVQYHDVVIGTYTLRQSDASISVLTLSFRKCKSLCFAKTRFVAKPLLACFRSNSACGAVSNPFTARGPVHC